MTTHYDTLKQATVAYEILIERDGRDTWVLESSMNGRHYVRPITDEDIAMREKIRAKFGKGDK
jgi:hypothetical protein